MQRRTVVCLALGLTISVVVACTSFGESPDDGSPQSPEAGAVAQDASPLPTEAGGGDAAFDGGSPAANLIGDIANDGVGGCLSWTAFNARTQFYDAAGEGICIMCFSETDGGVDGTGKAVLRESYVDWSLQQARFDAGTFAGTVTLETPPADTDASPAATNVILNLYANSASKNIKPSFGTSVAPTGAGVMTTNSLELTTSDIGAGVKIITFRIDGDHSPNSCVAIRRPRLVEK